MASSPNTQELRDLANRYLWMHNRDWVGMSEADEPIIVVEGDGIRVRDSEGRSWIDVNGGYNSVNLGYGRVEAYGAVNRASRTLGERASMTTLIPAERFDA